MSACSKYILFEILTLVTRKKNITRQIPSRNTKVTRASQYGMTDDNHTHGARALYACTYIEINIHKSEETEKWQLLEIKTRTPGLRCQYCDTELQSPGNPSALSIVS